MAKINLTPLSVMIDETWGPLGTPERDEMEAQLKADVQAYHLGQAIKEERLRQQLSGEQLGERLGVKKAQISKIENGKSSMTIATMTRVLEALGFENISLDLGNGTKIPL